KSAKKLTKHRKTLTPQKLNKKKQRKTARKNNKKGASQQESNFTCDAPFFILFLPAPVFPPLSDDSWTPAFLTYKMSIPASAGVNLPLRAFLSAWYLIPSPALPPVTDTHRSPNVPAETAAVNLYSRFF